MNYKYRKNQLFGKRLKVPKYILNKVYNSTVSIIEFFEYELDDKIPHSCLLELDRQIIEKFGIEKIKKLDFELLSSYVSDDKNYLKKVLLNINSSVENINETLYELVKDEIPPSSYSSSMKELYSNRLFNETENLTSEMENFNNGKLSLIELVKNWNLYKNKDLSFCLQKDKQNTFNITDSQLKDFMDKLEPICSLIINNSNIYQFIYEYNNCQNENEKHQYIKKVTDIILEKTIPKRGYQSLTNLSNNEYKELFKYSSLKDYLNKKNRYSEYEINKLLEELKTLPSNYIFNIQIPFNVISNMNVLSFIGEYGLKNIVDFDNECGHFFTKNNCMMLTLMFDMYLHYAGNENNMDKNIYATSSNDRYDSSGKFLGRLYSKDEFYESMRRMIVYGPSDYNYTSKAPDYRDMTGEFRRRNEELFISEDANEELQKLFYTKSITAKILKEHPEYIPYLKGKNLSSCFKAIDIKVKNSNAPLDYENIYQFLSKRMDFNSLMNFITEYSDILDIVFNRNMYDNYNDEPEFFSDDSIDLIEQKINNTLRKMIIEKGIQYPKHIPQNLIIKHPTMFLSKDAPLELQEAFYNRKINTDFIINNPHYMEYLRNIDLEILYQYMPIPVIEYPLNIGMGLVNGNINIVKAITNVFGNELAFDVMLSYGKYLEKAYVENQLHIVFKKTTSQEYLLEEMDKSILKTIIAGKLKYDENMPIHFKNSNPTLFLNNNVPQNIKNKFYNREFTFHDFEDNPKLLDIFENTNIACGFNEDMAWVIPLFSDNYDFMMANYNRLQVINAYNNIQDITLKNAFREYVIAYGSMINIENITCLHDVLSRLSLSNSSEIFTFRKELATQILNSSNPIEMLNKIEDVFLRNNLPTIGKIYSCFEILHPDFSGFNFNNSSTISPILKKMSTRGKKVIVFSDLIKSSFGSNNRTVNNYLKNIEIGSKLYKDIKNGQLKYDDLSEEFKRELMIFSKHLATLYNNTMNGKKEAFEYTDDTIKNISELEKKLSPTGDSDYDLADRIISMFCYYTGIDTLEEAKNYIKHKIKMADTRNRNAAKSQMTLEQGDFIKGIGDITYLRNILQNGSVSKEYLGSSAGSDATPLDTDISMITRKDGTISEKIADTAAVDYGPIWFVLKYDDRFLTTRTNSENLDVKNDMAKMEVFYTGVLGNGHYGIRTGFASSEINYIVMEKYDPRVGLEIAMNGFYIPIANKEGKIIFTPNDYDKIRNQMKGLAYYDENQYTFSPNLVTDETDYIATQIDKNNYEVQVKREKIYTAIKKALTEVELQLKTFIDGDLSDGIVELIDTGSTGRGTNKPGDGDFDFMMRLDSSILSNNKKLEALKQILLKNLGKENTTELTATGDFRLKDVQLDNETIVDIDITFTKKTDKITYSTDMSLQDRLSSIKKIDPDKYKYVVANILLAKQVLKKGEVYKPNRGEIPQGGLGGVGIENWILQNGGSFIDASKSFLDAANGKSFEEFRATYQIWDFGENHLAERNGKYSHDNFVYQNMNEEGYYKMVQILMKYINQYNQTQSESISR